MFLGWFPFLGGSFVFLDVGPSILFFVFSPFFWQGFIIDIWWCFITRLYNWKLQGGFLGSWGVGFVGVGRGPREIHLELTTLRK